MRPAQSSDETLAEIDATLDDYVEWSGSVDSASWAADGSHERDTAHDPWARRYPAATTATSQQRRGARPDYVLVDEATTFTGTELDEVVLLGSLELVPLERLIIHYGLVDTWPDADQPAWHPGPEREQRRPQP